MEQRCQRRWLDLRAWAESSLSSSYLESEDKRRKWLPASCGLRDLALILLQDRAHIPSVQEVLTADSSVTPLYGTPTTEESCHTRVVVSLQCESCPWSGRHWHKCPVSFGTTLMASSVAELPKGLAEACITHACLPAPPKEAPSATLPLTLLPREASLIDEGHSILHVRRLYHTHDTLLTTTQE